MINQLYFLISSIMSHTVIHQHVEPVPLGPHVDEEGDGVPHVDWSGDSVPGEAVPRPDLHEALWGGEGEYHWVRCVGSGAKIG